MISAKLIIMDNKKEGYITLSHLNHRQHFHGVWAQMIDRGDTGSRHGAAAHQTDMEQADRVHPGRHRLCCGSGQRVEVPISLLQEWRR